MSRLSYIITGTGRCGTAFMAQTFTSAGVNCSHERVFSYTGIRTELIVREKLQGESSWCVVPFMFRDAVRESTIIHIVRHPMKVIISLMASDYYQNPPRPWDRFLYKWLPELERKETPLKKAMHQYVNWNVWIERQCTGREVFRHRIEDPASNLFSRLGLMVTPTFNEPSYNTSRGRANAIYRDELRFADLPAGNDKQAIRTLAGRYGYEL